MYEMGRPPIRNGSSEAPMTATDCGLSSLIKRARSLGRVGWGAVIVRVSGGIRVLLLLLSAAK